MEIIGKAIIGKSQPSPKTIHYVTENGPGWDTERTARKSYQCDADCRYPILIGQRYHDIKGYDAGWWRCRLHIGCIAEYQEHVLEWACMAFEETGPAARDEGREYDPVTDEWRTQAEAALKQERGEAEL